MLTPMTSSDSDFLFTTAAVTALVVPSFFAAVCLVSVLYCHQPKAAVILPTSTTAETSSCETARVALSTEDLSTEIFSGKRQSEKRGKVKR